MRRARVGQPERTRDRGDVRAVIHGYDPRRHAAARGRRIVQGEYEDISHYHVRRGDDVELLRRHEHAAQDHFQMVVGAVVRRGDRQGQTLCGIEQRARRRTEDAHHGRAGVDHRDVEENFGRREARRVRGLRAELEERAGRGIRRSRESQHARVAAGQVGEDAKRADADDRHVGHPYVVRGAHDEREGLAVGHGSAWRLAAPERRRRGLVAQHGDDESGQRPVVAEAIGSDGAEGRRAACRERCGRRERGVGGRAQRREILGETDAGARLVCCEHGLDSNARAGDRGLV